MPVQLGSGNEFVSVELKDHRAKTGPAEDIWMDGADPDPLERALAGMGCVMSLSRIPDLLSEDDDSVLPSAGNLFGTADEIDDDIGRVNLLRQTGRSRAGQGRVLALRRRAARSQMLPSEPVGHAGDDLRRIRAHIFGPTDEDLARQARPSVPLRLATHAIGLSLVATALPVGAAMMTYNLLRGEDMQMTARMTTLTGLALAVLAGNPELAHLLGT